MEKIIGEDENDERTKKVKERFDHYLAQQVDEGDADKTSAKDPRQEEPEQDVPEAPRVDHEEHQEEPLHCDIGSPMKTDIIDEDMGEDLEFLDDGPTGLSERRIQSPVRPPATKRKKNIHVGAGNQEEYRGRDERGRGRHARRLAPGEARGYEDR